MEAQNHQNTSSRLFGIRIFWPYGDGSIDFWVIELDDGIIETGTPIKFDGKNDSFRLRFSLKPIRIDGMNVHKYRLC